MNRLKGYIQERERLGSYHAFSPYHTLQTLLGLLETRKDEYTQFIKKMLEIVGSELKSTEGATVWPELTVISDLIDFMSNKDLPQYTTKLAQLRA